MGDIKLEVPPVGVKVLRSLDGFENIEVFRGASYCEAVKRATSGREVLVTTESIEVCKWAPVIIFCTGAVAWGANKPSHLTSGLPWEMFDRVCGRLEFLGYKSE